MGSQLRTINMAGNLFILLSTLTLFVLGQPANDVEATPTGSSAVTATRRTTENEGRSLLAAAENGELQTVKELLNRGANIEAQDGYGRTALHWAAWENHLDIVKELLERGANIEAQGGNYDSGRTALHLAAWGTHPDIVKELLNRGANIEAQDGDGNKALHMA